MRAWDEGDGQGVSVTRTLACLSRMTCMRNGCDGSCPWVMVVTVCMAATTCPHFFDFLCLQLLLLLWRWRALSQPDVFIRTARCNDKPQLMCNHRVSETP